MPAVERERPRDELRSAYNTIVDIMNGLDGNIPYVDEAIGALEEAADCLNNAIKELEK